MQLFPLVTSYTKTLTRIPTAWQPRQSLTSCEIKHSKFHRRITLCLVISPVPNSVLYKQYMSLRGKLHNWPNSTQHWVCEQLTLGQPEKEFFCILKNPKFNYHIPQQPRLIISQLHPFLTPTYFFSIRVQQGEVILIHTMQEHGRMEVQLHSIVTSALHRGEWSASSHLSRSTQGKQTPVPNKHEASSSILSVICA